MLPPTRIKKLLFFIADASSIAVSSQVIHSKVVSHPGRFAWRTRGCAPGCLITSCVIGTAMAQSCESKAVSAEGKPLHRAAKTSFVRKCKRDACESEAISAEGAFGGQLRQQTRRYRLRTRTRPCARLARPTVPRKMRRASRDLYSKMWRVHAKRLSLRPSQKHPKSNRSLSWSSRFRPYRQFQLRCARLK